MRNRCKWHVDDVPKNPRKRPSCSHSVHHVITSVCPFSWTCISIHIAYSSKKGNSCQLSPTFYTGLTSRVPRIPAHTFGRNTILKSGFEPCKQHTYNPRHAITKIRMKKNQISRGPLELSLVTSLHRSVQSSVPPRAKPCSPSACPPDPTLHTFATLSLENQCLFPPTSQKGFVRRLRQLLCTDLYWRFGSRFPRTSAISYFPVPFGSAFSLLKAPFSQNVTRFVPAGSFSHTRTGCGSARCPPLSITASSSPPSSGSSRRERKAASSRRN